jgi:molybdate transport system regulatory protein
MRLSIRNQLSATIETVTRGEVMGTTRLRLDGGQEVTSAITLDAIDDLGLADGQHVTALVKSTDVAIASGAVNGLSIRNQISGTIERVDHGVVMTTVKIAIAGGQSLVAAITKDGAQDLNLAEGDSITALMKSTEVSIAVD